MEVVENKYNQQLKNGIDPKESIQYLYDTHERMVPSKLIEECLYSSIEIIYTYTNEFDYINYVSKAKQRFFIVIIHFLMYE